MDSSKVNCPECGEEIVVNLREFVDVKEEPRYKEQILNGTFFLVQCPGCGDEILTEYPIMYTDSDKKLNIYMAPDHDDSLLESLNSLEIPSDDGDSENVFRVTSGWDELVEKILIADGGRDDRIVELYKYILSQSLDKDLPGIDSKSILYYLNWEKSPIDMGHGEDEYFIIFGFENDKGEQPTVPFDENIYNDLKTAYLKYLEIGPNEYAEVDDKWIKAHMKDIEEEEHHE